MRTTFDLPDHLVTTLKIRAAEERKRMKVLVVEALTEFLDKPSAPAALPASSLPTISVGKVLVQNSETSTEVAAFRKIVHEAAPAKNAMVDEEDYFKQHLT